MYYYAVEFYASKKLAEFFYVYQDEEGCDCIDQTFYVKSKKEIKNKKRMKKFLLKNFKPSKVEGFTMDLCNCVYPSTAKKVCRFYEIDGEEFEESCGVPA